MVLFAYSYAMGLKGNAVKICNSSRCCKSGFQILGIAVFITQPLTGNCLLGRHKNQDKSEDLPL